MSVLDRFSLQGKIALVTGGAGPLFGRSVSTALLEAGATVICASRSLERNLAFCKSQSDKGFPAYGMQVDMAQPDTICRLHDDVMGRFGKIDILVNSAVAMLDGGFETQTVEDWLSSARIDMVGLFYICQLFVADMVRCGQGRIINISSIYGVVANDPAIYDGTTMVQAPTYNFIKAGMINFTRYIATYYGRSGVRANCICPGGFFNDQPGSFVTNYCRRVPIGRMMNQEDIQGAVVYLASDASEYVTGTVLMVDGGWTAI
jgi:NAD(P)-dependent dehydrogenase (short-subunit alcohol dehydrogenase family)